MYRYHKYNAGDGVPLATIERLLMLCLVHGRHKGVNKKSGGCGFAEFLEAYKQKSAVIYCMYAGGELLACRLIYLGSGKKLEYIDNRTKTRLKMPAKDIKGAITEFIAMSQNNQEAGVNQNEQKGREISHELARMYAERYAVLELKLIEDFGSMPTKVRGIMAEHKLSQRDFAIRTGLTQPTISRILSTGKISNVSLFAICRAFKLDLQAEFRLQAKEATELDVSRREQLMKLDSNVENVGDLFTKIMDIYQYSPSELAARLGVTPGSIIRAVKTRQCQISLIRSAEKAFGISINGFLPSSAKPLLSGNSGLLRLAREGSRGEPIDKKEAKLAVQSLMEKNELNQSTFAGRIGVSQGTISRLLSEERCSFRLLALISAVFDTDIRGRGSASMSANAN